jgi:diguanylate cyclase (GGDEF)-like protein/PAS domain S-box-containing protein
VREPRVGRWTTDAFDRLTDFVVVVDPGGRIEYANPYAVGLLGLPVEAVLGQPVTDYLHPDDVVRAIEVMVRMSTGGLGVEVTPAVYRIGSEATGWHRVELNGTVVPDRDGDRLVVFGRYSGDHDLQDQLMELLTADTPTRQLMELVPEFGLWRQPDMHYAAVYRDEEGRSAWVGSPDVAALGDLDDPTTPWAEATRDGVERLQSVDELHPDFAARAREAGFADVWSIPVDDPMQGRPAALVFCREIDGPDPEVHRYALEMMARAMRVVLRSRHQVTALRRAARVDPLTGLANRTEFWDVLETLGEVTAPKRVGVLYVDLDAFKAVNDNHGHAMGDLVLAEAATRLASVLRPGDTVARIGGDEFAIICPSLGADTDAVAIADRVVAALGAPFHVGDAVVSIGASVGIATVSPDDLDPDALLETADEALYQAKQEGRGRWHLAGSS